jgi:hypothetical protein
MSRTLRAPTLFSTSRPTCTTAGTKATKPPKITSPYLLLVVPGTLVKLGDDWKIASMSMNREFEF